MTNPNVDANSEVKEAADKVNPKSVVENLENNDKKKSSEALKEEEKTPFIDDELRTDK